MARSPNRLRLLRNCALHAGLNGFESQAATAMAPRPFARTSIPPVGRQASLEGRGGLPDEAVEGRQIRRRFPLWPLVDATLPDS
jgi:hypothetical protein